MESQYSLRWNNYPSQLTEAFGSLLLEEDLVDVTLSCEGKKIKAHKMLLSACSPYFRDIFKENPCQHPVIVFKNVQYLDLKAIIEFMYCGEVNVFQEQLESFLNTAGILEVKGLTDQENEKEVNETIRRAKTGLEENKQPNLAKKQRLDKTKEPGFETVGNNSPPPKKMKSNVEIQPVGGSVPTEIGPIFVKEEVEDFDFIDENHAESEGSGRFSAEVPDPRSSPGINSGASKDIGLGDPARFLSLKISENVKIFESNGETFRETENSKYRLSKFNKMWMLDKRFKPWLQECESNSYSAFCKVCQKVVALSNMGTRALTSHMTGKKHQKAVSQWEEAL